MKPIKIIPYALILMLLLVSACSKKVMENEAATEPAATPPAAEEPAAPAPEPVAATPATDERALFLDQLVYFEFDSAVLTPEAQSLLQQKAQWLNNNPDVVALIIEGHCDERGTEAYNMALGAKRADAVKNYLMDLGVNVSKLDTQSFGEEKPAALGHNEDAWAQNRRASFNIQ